MAAARRTHGGVTARAAAAGAAGRLAPSDSSRKEAPSSPAASAGAAAVRRLAGAASSPPPPAPQRPPPPAEAPPSPPRRPRPPWRKGKTGKEGGGRRGGPCRRRAGEAAGAGGRGAWWAARSLSPAVSADGAARSIAGAAAQNLSEAPGRRVGRDGPPGSVCLSRPPSRSEPAWSRARAGCQTRTGTSSDFFPAARPPGRPAARPPGRRASRYPGRPARADRPWASPGPGLPRRRPGASWSGWTATDSESGSRGCVKVRVDSESAWTARRAASRAASTAQR